MSCHAEGKLCFCRQGPWIFRGRKRFQRDPNRGEPIPIVQEVSGKSRQISGLVFLRIFQCKLNLLSGMSDFALLSDGVYEQPLDAAALSAVIEAIKNGGTFETEREDDQGLIVLHRKGT